MNIKFYFNGAELDECRSQANIPRVGECVVIQGVGFTVLDVTWDYDISWIYIQLKEIE